MDGRIDAGRLIGSQVKSRLMIVRLARWFPRSSSAIRTVSRTKPLALKTSWRSVVTAYALTVRILCVAASSSTALITAVVRSRYAGVVWNSSVALARSGMRVGNVGYRLHHILKGLADDLQRAGVEGAKG